MDLTGAADALDQLTGELEALLRTHCDRDPARGLLPILLRVVQLILPIDMRALKVPPDAPIPDVSYKECQGISEDATRSWVPACSGRRGGQQKYSDLAIETALPLRLVFNLPPCQAAGFAATAPALLDPCAGKLAAFVADGAYDVRPVDDAAGARGAAVVVPPRSDAAVAALNVTPRAERDPTVARVQEVGTDRLQHSARADGSREDKSPTRSVPEAHAAGGLSTGRGFVRQRRGCPRPPSALRRSRRRAGPHGMAATPAGTRGSVPR